MDEATAIEKLIFKAIESLDERTRLVYQLHDMQAYSIAEISPMLKQSEEKTRVEIDLARRSIVTWVQAKLIQALSHS